MLRLFSRKRRDPDYRPVHRHGSTAALALFTLAAAAGAAALHMGPQRPIITGHARIIDGDSLMVGGTEIRLMGVDAPELAQRCAREGRPTACGKDAARQLSALIAGQTVTCERRDIDRFGRTLAVCRTDGVDLGQAMVAGGHAVSYGSYQREEAQARREKRGLWAGEFTPPREWRDQERVRTQNGV